MKPGHRRLLEAYDRFRHAPCPQAAERVGEAALRVLAGRAVSQQGAGLGALPLLPARALLEGKVCEDAATAAVVCALAGTELEHRFRSPLNDLCEPYLDAARLVIERRWEDVPRVLARIAQEPIGERERLQRRLQGAVDTFNRGRIVGLTLCRAADALWAGVGLARIASETGFAQVRRDT